MVVRGFVTALCAVLPLVAVEAWTGFRLAPSDLALSAIAATEQPLSVRSPAGTWAMLLALGWFVLAYWHRRLTLWEAALVIIGGAAALIRLGNAWLYALALVVPLARQLTLWRPRDSILVALAVVSLGVTAYTAFLIRPPDLPRQVPQAVLIGPPAITVFADWRWAATLHRELPGSHVLGAGGFTSESPDFWSQYVRLNYGGEFWAETLQTYHVDVLVLDAGDQARPLADLVRSSADWRVTYDAAGVLVAHRSGT